MGTKRKGWKGAHSPQERAIQEDRAGQQILQAVETAELEKELTLRKANAKKAELAEPVTFTKQITNCTECPHVQIVGDPDPTDSFCSDDEAALCAISPNTAESKQWLSGNPWPHSPITVSCRPYQIKTSCNIPEWCPLRKEK